MGPSSTVSDKRLRGESLLTHYKRCGTSGADGIAPQGTVDDYQRGISSIYNYTHTTDPNSTGGDLGHYNVQALNGQAGNDACKATGDQARVPVLPRPP